MANLYLVSPNPAAGKTALTIGLGLEWREGGRDVGYMKPLGTAIAEADGRLCDSDALFVRSMLGLDDPIELVSPVVITPELRDRAISRGGVDCWADIEQAYKLLQARHSVLLLEGLDSLAGGSSVGANASRILGLSEAVGVLVLRGRSEYIADLALLARQVLGERLKWVIINAVPREVLESTAATFGPFVSRHGMRLLGVIPEDRLLTSTTVSDLIALLQGKVLTKSSTEDVLLHTFAIGAMGPEYALRVFMREHDYAVITGGDRHSVQLAALEAGAKCLVLTGNIAPERSVLTQAEEQGVPVIMVGTSTKETVDLMERSLGRARVSSPRQIEILRKTIRIHLDLEGLQASLGI
jgi:uncharacterized protein